MSMSYLAWIRLFLNTYFGTKISADYLLSRKSYPIYDAVNAWWAKGTDRLYANEKVVDFLRQYT